MDNCVKILCIVTIATPCHKMKRYYISFGQSSRLIYKNMGVIETIQNNNYGQVENRETIAISFFPIFVKLFFDFDSYSKCQI